MERQVGVNQISVMLEAENDTSAMEACMFLKWAAIFFVIAMVAAAFGFSGIAEGASDVAEILFYIFLAIFFTFVISGVVVARKLTA